MAPNLPKVDWLTRGCGYMSSHLVLCSMARGRGLSDHKGLLNDNASLDGRFGRVGGGAGRRGRGRRGHGRPSCLLCDGWTRQMAVGEFKGFRGLRASDYQIGQIALRAIDRFVV